MRERERDHMSITHEIFCWYRIESISTEPPSSTVRYYIHVLLFVWSARYMSLEAVAMYYNIHCCLPHHGDCFCPTLRHRKTWMYSALMVNTIGLCERSAICDAVSCC